MMNSVVLASVLVVAGAETINLTYKDCGHRHTHAKVKSLTPDSIQVPGKSTIVGSGVLDADQTSAHFKLRAHKGPITLLSGKGNICEDTTINFPFGTGSVTVKGLDCPVKAGDLEVEVDLSLLSDLFEDGENSLLSIHIEAHADDTHDQVICLNVDASLGTTTGPPPSSVHGIQNHASDPPVCLQAEQTSPSNGQSVTVAECDGSEKQDWKVDLRSPWFKAITYKDFCMDASLILWECNSSLEEQQWEVSECDDAVVLRSALRSETGRPRSLKVSGQTLWMGLPNHQPSEKWQLPPPPAPDPPRYSYQKISPSSDTNLCLDLPDGVTTNWDLSNGVQVQLQECNVNTNYQHWHFDNRQIRYAPDESKCIDAYAGADRLIPQLWDCNGSPQQTWVYDPDASSLSLSESSTCLEVWTGPFRLHLTDCTGDWNQQWSFWDPSALFVV